MGRALLWVLAAIVGVLTLAPVLIVIPFSFSGSGFLQFPPGWGGWQWYQTVLDDPAWRDAALMSVKVGLIATVTATVVGTAAAYALVRGRVRFANTITAALILPMVVPIIIFALGSYAVGSDLQLVGSIWALGLIHSILALPLVVLNVRASLQLANPRLEMAARSLGASPLTAFLKVTLPLIMPGVVSGAVLAFVLSFDETVVALFMTNDIQPTLPVKLFSSIRFELQPTVAAVSVLLLAVTIAAVLVAWGAMRFNRRRLRGVDAVPATSTP
jgi:putative spermidine/putrescine transport system permease protein